MPTTDFDRVSAAQGAVITAAQQLADFRRHAADGHFPEAYRLDQDAALVAAVRAADAAALTAFRDWRAASVAEASVLRARADADVDATVRLADTAERAAIIASAQDTETLLAAAASMIAAGRPQRAALLVSAAEARGARGPDVHRLSAEVGDALDAAIPARKEARALEDDFVIHATEFDANRGRILAASIGMASDGSAGTGAAPERAAASIAAKVATVVGGVAGGFPVGSGTNTKGEDAALYRDPRSSGEPMAR